MSSLSKWALGFVASLIEKVATLFLAFKHGEKTQKLKTAEEALEYAKKGKEIEGSVNSLPDGAALDELRKDYSR